MSETSNPATDFVEATLQEVADPNLFSRLIMYAMAVFVVGLYTGLVPAPMATDTELRARTETLGAAVTALRTDVKAVADLIAAPAGSVANTPATKADLEDLRASLEELNSRFAAMTKAKAAESPPKRK